MKEEVYPWQRRLVLLIMFLLVVLNASCSYFLPQSGPSTFGIKKISLDQRLGIEKYVTLVKLNPRIILAFPDVKIFWTKDLEGFVVGRYSPIIDTGDVLEIFVYESPPPLLFSSASILGIQQNEVVAFRIPPQIVDENGYILVPFAGRIKAKGKRPEEVAQSIAAKLARKANNPQVVVKLSGFNSSYVTVFGEVRESRKVPLTYSNFRLLDALASVGGVTSPINKTLVQIDRKGKTIRLPLEEVIRDPKLNLNLQPGDVITVVYKTQSAVFLGASGRNMELEFEARGINLSQALGRVGGLQDDRAHAKGLFIFRLEDKDVLRKIGIKPKAVAMGGKIPVIYNVDLSDPASFLILKNFYLKDGDIVYIATAPAVQLQKFLRVISPIISDIFMIDRLSK
ncbi:polysaccharide biosynthesis/export family protein [Thermosulfurimonas dismutans]|uniref:Capsular polysaccharide biosynthesis/export periplasmic protein WcbC n=1 Tax=Thermosulfurimonas dismutans TaxID=999894 RepID=A0A179D240_9BACT|nr:polysaccharide biosynthesis/export family protein [Thermosulfurimonas dismutans]OAQ19861.1 Capsular polysaccharide biosynthesis/export periplasmic protein WcbC [Thermosulfurimonas dismutans]